MAVSFKQKKLGEDDLSFLPDQPEQEKEDLSFLPDQAEPKKDDLSFLPDKPDQQNAKGFMANALKAALPGPFQAVADILGKPEEKPGLNELQTKTMGMIQPGVNPVVSALMNTDVGKRAASGMASGALGTVGNMAAAIPAAEQFLRKKQGFASQYGQKAADVVGELSAQLMPEDPNFFDHTASGLASMAMFALPGTAVGSGVANIARMGKVAAKLAPAVGAGVSAILEAGTEAGGVYQDKLKQGFSPDIASKSAFDNFWKNVILVGITNRFGIFGDKFTGLKKALVSAPIEGIQEAGQSILSQLATKKEGEEIDWGEVATSAGVGALIGGAAGPLINVSPTESSTEKAPRGTVIDGKTLGPKTENYVSTKFPQLYEGILNKEVPLPPEQVNDLLAKAASAGEVVLLKGGTAEQANQAATETFIKEATPLVTQAQELEASQPPKKELPPMEEILQKFDTEESAIERKPQPVFGLKPDIAALQEGRLVESEASKNQPTPQVGITPEIRLAQAKEAAQQILVANKIDDRVVTYIVDEIVADKKAFKEGYGKEYDKDSYDILGVTYMPEQKGRIEAVIQLARGADTKTGRHEAFHAVSNILLEENEQSIITKKYGDMEKAADAFGEYRATQASTGDSVIDRVFQRITEFLEKFSNYLTENNFTTADELFQKIEGGKFAERAGSPGQAKFIGYQDMGTFGPPMALYTVPEGLPDAGSSVSAETLQSKGISVPATPGFQEWKKNRGTTQYSAAYHGSPYEFDKFSSEKIGTGEGESIYGHGLYFTSKKEVADFYKRDQQSKGKGRVYKVDIPDDTDYLDADKPLDKQSDKVKKLLKSNPALSSRLKGLDKLYGDTESITGSMLYGHLADDLGSTKDASDTLSAAGIPGLKFIERLGIPGSETAPNYLLFDDSKVKILDVQYSAKPNPLRDINVNLFPTRQRQPKIYTERIALRRSLQRQASSAAQAYRQGIKDVNALKKEIVDGVKEGLPPEDRGQFLSTIANAKNERDLVRATLKLDESIEKSQRKMLVNSIKRETQRIAASKSIAIDYKFKVASIMNDILFQKPRASTLKRLTELKEYIQAQMEQGKDVGVPNYMLEKLRVLSGKPLSEFKSTELEDILGQIQSIADLGKVKLSLKKDVDAHNKQKDLAALALETKPIRLQITTQALPGEKLTMGQNLSNAYSDALNKAMSIKEAVMPMDVFFDVLDNSQNYAGPNTRIFKNRVDARFSTYLNELSQIKKQAVEKAKGLTPVNMERIGAHATREQDGGMEKIYNNYGIPKNPTTPEEIKLKEEFDKKIENVQLNDKEMVFYNWMRAKLDEVRPRIAETMKNVFNADLGQVKNYFPFVTDFTLMSEEDVQNSVLSQIIGLSKTTQKGFTIERTGAGRQKIVLNAADVFNRHMDDVLYLTNVGETIKYLGELANTEEYQQIAGDEGAKEVREWIDTLAKKGGGLGGQQIRFLDKLRVNVGIATLGFKLSSALIQITPIGQGATLIGKYAFKGGVDYGTNEQWRLFVYENMPEVRERAGGDPAYQEFISRHGVKAKVGEAGYWLLQKLDLYAAGSVGVGAYQKYMRDNNLEIDLEKPNQQALQYAQRIVRRTQSSGFFKDVPPAISRGKLTGSRSLDRAIFQFQNFVLNNFSLLTHEGIRSGVAKGNVGQSASVYMWAILMAMAGTGLRLGLKDFYDFMFGREEKKPDPFSERLLKGTVRELLGNVPFLSQAMSVIGYKSFPVPSLDWISKAGEGITTAATGKKPDTRARGAARAAFALARPLGIPGTLQLEEFFRIMNSKRKRDRR